MVCRFYARRYEQNNNEAETKMKPSQNPNVMFTQCYNQQEVGDFVRSEKPLKEHECFL